jgi:hypothetical protein
LSAESFDDLEDTRRDAALQLAERGFHVSPVDAKSKRPDKLRALHGVRSATRDSRKIAGWFTVTPIPTNSSTALAHLMSQSTLTLGRHA